MEASAAKKSVAPGMDMVIVAGELYEIQDDSGQNLNLKGVESEWAMSFLKAYDSFRAIRKTLGRDHEQTQAAFMAVEEMFDNMPVRLVLDMPSYRAGGIIVPGGG